MTHSDMPISIDIKNRKSLMDGLSGPDLLYGGKKKVRKATVRRMKSFLRELTVYGNATRAAAAVGVSRDYFYRLKRELPAFREAWDMALELGVEALEDECRRRAFEGVAEPVFYQGEQCGAIQRYSDGLAMFLLKAHRPDKYRERSTVDLNHKQVAASFDLGPVPPDPVKD